MDEESLLKSFCRNIKLDNEGGLDEDFWFKWELFLVPTTDWEELRFHLGDDIHQFYYVYPSNRKLEDVSNLTRYGMKPLERIHSYTLKSGVVVSVPDGYSMTPFAKGEVLIVHVPEYDEEKDQQIREVLDSVQKALEQKGVSEIERPVFMLMDSEVEFMTLQKVVDLVTEVKNAI